MYWLTLDALLEVLKPQLINELPAHYQGSRTSFDDIRQYLVSGTGRLGVGPKAKVVKPLRSFENAVDTYLTTEYASKEVLDRHREAARMLCGIMIRKPSQFTDEILREKDIKVSNGFIALDIVLRVAFVSLTGQQPDQPEKLHELRDCALTSKGARRRSNKAFDVSRLGDVLTLFVESVLAGKPLNERLEAAQEMVLGIHVPEPKFPQTASSHIK